MKPILYNFIIPEPSGVSVEQLEQDELEAHWQLCCRGEYCWSYQTFKLLKDHGLLLKLSLSLDPSAINLAHGNTLRALPKRHDCYCVSLQADFPHYPLAQYHVVQNQAQVRPRSIFIPLWPQLGQSSRKASRKEVLQVAYQGAAHFTDLDLKKVNDKLEPLGLSFRLLNEDSWRDLGDVDVLIGIRKFGKRDYKRKPPSKMVNAWHANIPFIGGWDSAYVQLGTPDKDYLRVSSSDELIEMILRLKNDPKLYDALVQQGKKTGEQFTIKEVALRWKTLLERDISEDFKCWSGRRGKKLGFSIKYFWFALTASTRYCLRSLYKIGGVKQIRDRYYDPVR